jgi:hypothetical protein
MWEWDVKERSEASGWASSIYLVASSTVGERHCVFASIIAGTACIGSHIGRIHEFMLLPAYQCVCVYGRCDVYGRSSSSIAPLLGRLTSRDSPYIVSGAPSPVHPRRSLGRRAWNQDDDAHWTCIRGRRHMGQGDGAMENGGSIESFEADWFRPAVPLRRLCRAEAICVLGIYLPSRASWAKAWRGGG